MPGKGRRTLDLAAEVLVLARLGEVEALAGGLEAVEERADGREPRRQRACVGRLGDDTARERRGELRDGGHGELERGGREATPLSLGKRKLAQPKR